MTTTNPQTGLLVYANGEQGMWGVALDTDRSPWAYATDWLAANNTGEPESGLGIETKDSWHDVRAAVESNDTCELATGPDGLCLWIEADRPAPEANQTKETR